MTNPLGDQRFALPRLALACAATTALLAAGTLLGVWLVPASALMVAVLGSVLVLVSALLSLFLQYRNLRTTAVLEHERRALAEAQQLSAATNAARAKLLAAISHDLRQPLHALGLFLDALELRVAPGEGGKILAKTREAAFAVGRMFDAIVDWARLEADAVKPRAEPFAVGPLLEQIKDDVQISPVEVRLVRTSATAMGDAPTAGSVLRTLLANAVELEPKGALLGVRRRGGRPWIELHVSAPGAPAGKWEVLRQSPLPPGQALDFDLRVARRLAGAVGLELAVKTVADHGFVLALGLSRP